MINGIKNPSSDWSRDIIWKLSGNNKYGRKLSTINKIHCSLTKIVKKTKNLIHYHVNLPLQFSKMQSQPNLKYWEIFQRLMGPSADKPDGDAGFIFQQESAPSTLPVAPISGFRAIVPLCLIGQNRPDLNPYEELYHIDEAINAKGLITEFTY